MRFESTFVSVSEGVLRGERLIGLLLPFRSFSLVLSTTGVIRTRSGGILHDVRIPQEEFTEKRGTVEYGSVGESSGLFYGS